MRLGLVIRYGRRYGKEISVGPDFEVVVSIAKQEDVGHRSGFLCCRFPYLEKARDGGYLMVGRCILLNKGPSKIIRCKSS